MASKNSKTGAAKQIGCLAERRTAMRRRVCTQPSATGSRANMGKPEHIDQTIGGI